MLLQTQADAAHAGVRCGVKKPIGAGVEDGNLANPENFKIWGVYGPRCREWAKNLKIRKISTQDAQDLLCANFSDF